MVIKVLLKFQIGPSYFFSWIYRSTFHSLNYVFFLFLQSIPTLINNSSCLCFTIFGHYQDQNVLLEILKRIIKLQKSAIKYTKLPRKTVGILKKYKKVCGDHLYSWFQGHACISLFQINHTYKNNSIKFRNNQDHDSYNKYMS